MIQAILEGADNVITQAPCCWLMTLSGGAIAARPMGSVISPLSQTDWCLYYLVDVRSNKARDIRSARQVHLIFQNGNDAFVSLAGVAEVITDAGTMAQRWQPSYDRIFPTADERASAGFIDIRADALRVWIRGLTPEPFGLRSLTLRRAPGGDWHSSSEGA
jgi:general stress protein 26